MLEATLWIIFQKLTGQNILSRCLEVNSNKKLILEIGCGGKKVFPESIGLDVRHLKGVDVISDARDLPFEDEYFDHVYSSHVIEHFSHREVKEVLEEWIRVLKVGGTFEIRCPDLRTQAFLFALKHNWNDIINIYGNQDYPENFHYCGFSQGLLKAILSDHGIIKIKRQYDGYKRILFLQGELHINGIKAFRGEHGSK